MYIKATKTKSRNEWNTSRTEPIGWHWCLRDYLSVRVSSRGWLDDANTMCCIYVLGDVCCLFPQRSSWLCYVSALHRGLWPYCLPVALPTMYHRRRFQYTKTVTAVCYFWLFLNWFPHFSHKGHCYCVIVLLCFQFVLDKIHSLVWSGMDGLCCIFDICQTEMAWYCSNICFLWFCLFINIHTYILTHVHINTHCHLY